MTKIGESTLENLRFEEDSFSLLFKSTAATAFGIRPFGILVVHIDSVKVGDNRIARIGINFTSCLIQWSLFMKFYISFANINIPCFCEHSAIFKDIHGSDLEAEGWERPSWTRRTKFDSRKAEELVHVPNHTVNAG